MDIAKGFQAWARNKVDPDVVQDVGVSSLLDATEKTWVFAAIHLGKKFPWGGEREVINEFIVANATMMSVDDPSAVFESLWHACECDLRREAAEHLRHSPDRGASRHLRGGLVGNASKFVEVESDEGEAESDETMENL